MRPAWLALAAVLTLGAVFGAVRVEPQVDFVDTVPDSPSVEAYRDVIERLEGVRFVAIYMADATGAGLRQADTFDQLLVEQASLTRFLEERFPGAFRHQLSAYEGMRAGHYMVEKVATAGNPRPESYSIPQDPVRYQVVRDQVLGDGSLDDVLAKDGGSALMLFFFATPDSQEARTLSGRVADALGDWRGALVTKDHQASGLLYSSHYTDERNGHDLRTWGLAAGAAVAVVLWWLLQRAANVGLALAGMAVAMLWTFGAMGLAGIRISFLTLFLAPVVIGIGIDGAVHLLHRSEEERGRTSRREAAKAALQHTGPAVFVASLTTAAGLVVLAAVPNPLFAEIGIVAALGIVLAWLSAIVFVMPLRSLLPSRPSASHPNRIGPRLAAWAEAVRRRRGLAIAGVVLVTLCGATLALQVPIESGSAENEFPQDDPVIMLQHRIEEEYGVFQRGYVIVRGDIAQPQVMQTLLWGASQAEGLPLFRNATSVVDLVLADEATDEGVLDVGRAALLGAAGTRPGDGDRLPTTASETAAAIDRLFADPLWRTLAPFTVTADRSLAVLAIQFDPWPDQQGLTAMRDGLDALAADMALALPSHDVQAGGAPMNRAAVIEQTPWNVAIATLGVAAAVGSVLAVAWRRRDALVTLTAVVLVLLAAVWLLGSIWVLDQVYAALGTANNASLTDMFLLAFAITVAVGVDDVVHLANRYWEQRDAGARPATARRDAFTHAGRAITGTSATTFVAFAVLGGVYFLQSKNLAILTAAGVAYAYALTMLLTPLALRR